MMNLFVIQLQCAIKPDFMVLFYFLKGIFFSVILHKGSSMGVIGFEKKYTLTRITLLMGGIRKEQGSESNFIFQVSRQKGTI